MKLQLAMDELSLEEALMELEHLVEYIDIVEVGTPFLIDVGREAVRRITEKFPQLEILCDAKIIDAGAYEAKLAYEAGAEYITVLGVTDDLTIKACVEEGKKEGRQVMVDMICVDNLANRVPAVEALGVDVIAVHTGADQQVAGRTPLEDLAEVKKYAKNTKVAVAGGINSQTISKYIQFKPDIVIVGSGILKAKDSVKEAGLIGEALKAGDAK